MKLSEIMGMNVYTDLGDYLGEVEEANLVDNKIGGWQIRVSRNSSLASFLGGAKGLIVPHQFVKAIGDILIVNKSAVPSKEEPEEEIITEE